MKTTPSRKKEKTRKAYHVATVGSANVPVYKRIAPNGSPCFMVSNYSTGKRRFDSYGNEAEAIEATTKLARQTSERQVLAAAMTNEQASEYAAAVPKLAPFNVGLLLRQFRQQNPEEFRRIKGLPLRARVGRADKARAGSTVAFIRSQRRDAFYRAKSNGTLDEISLLEAADEFRAPDRKEKAIPLHAAHHDHINSALNQFKASVVAEALQGETVDANQGPNEQRALRYLDGFSSLPFVNEDERALIQAAKLAIRRARFQNLQRQRNRRLPIRGRCSPTCGH